MASIWAGLLAVCVVAAGLILRRILQHLREETGIDHARRSFRLSREWLEARFLSELGKIDPLERLRWDDAHWHDEIVWARDRQTHRLLALVCVHFDSDVLPGVPGYPPRHATALFEYRRGRWHAEGKRLDEIRPDEAFFRLQRFEPIALPHRPV